jgi:tRNA dimethylallyltransferase
MATTAQKPELIVIVGPTASGKSELALKIAKKFNGEIIAADSRTIYIDMDIGTAKPTKSERKQVPHWGIDLIEPGETFSAYQFKQYAEEKIKEIQGHGNLPILVGARGKLAYPVA